MFVDIMKEFDGVEGVIYVLEYWLLKKWVEKAEGRGEEGLTGGFSWII
ncbi:hypothetical protein [Bacillus altitudinis]|nr:hypothetical protein [Bacillus altitudinis]